MASNRTAVLPAVNAEPGKPEPTITEQDTVTSHADTLYVKPGDVFKELTTITLQQITDLAKKKFSDVILAGHITDEQLSQFRSTYIAELIAAQHKQFRKQVTERKEKRERELYKELRKRGVNRADAIKASGYNPDLE